MCLVWLLDEDMRNFSSKSLLAWNLCMLRYCLGGGLHYWLTLGAHNPSTPGQGLTGTHNLQHTTSLLLDARPPETMSQTWLCRSMYVLIMRATSQGRKGYGHKGHPRHTPVLMFLIHRKVTWGPVHQLVEAVILFLCFLLHFCMDGEPLSRLCLFHITKALLCHQWSHHHLLQLSLMLLQTGN